MHHQTATAGYFKFALKARLEAHHKGREVQALLRQLSACHITSNLDMAVLSGYFTSIL